MPEAFITDLLSFCVEGVLPMEGDKLAPGDGVQVGRGPFIGQLGTILSLDDAGRVALFLEVMGGAIVKMDFADLECVRVTVMR